MITIAYHTVRREPHFEWFIKSLTPQIKASGFPLSEIRFVIVDFFRHEREPGPNNPFAIDLQCEVYHVEPKPNVWCGPHRLTKENWFSAANSRNTSICLAPDGWYLGMDDLSYCMPTFWKAVVDAMQRPGTITCGAYEKVKEFVFHDGGDVISFKPFPGGQDTRWHQVESNLEPCRGEWMYGASFVAPVEALLTVGGQPEICCGLGFEDVICGMALENAGYKFVYSKELKTLESEEHHHIEKAFRREDYGVSPNDVSHRVLNLVKGGAKYFPNYVDGGIRALRQKVLAGEPFPVTQIPDRHPFTSVLLKDL